MSNIKKYLFSLLVVFFLIFSSIIFINIFYYFNLISENIYRFFKIMSVIINIFIGGFIIGLNSNQKGYLNGLFLGLIIVSILFLFSVFSLNLQFKLIIYYLVILTSSCLGGTVGIRKKKKHI